MNQSEPLIPSQQSLWLEKKLDILKRLLPEEIERLNKHSVRVRKERGEMLWLDDDDAKVYIIDQGYLRICQSNAEGKRLIISMLGPADFFGHIAPDVLTLGSLYSLEVVRDIRLIVIDAPIFQEVLQNHTDMTMRMVKLLNERHKELEKRISSLLLKDIYSRLAELLMGLSIKYGEPCVIEPGKRDIQITHQELADFLGIARPTVSSLLGEFAQHQLVEKHNHKICMKYPDRVEKVIELGLAGA